MAIIKLKSSDGKVFKVEVKVACCSTTIKSMVDSLGVDESSEEEEIPVDVRGEILEKVLDWAEHHKNDPEGTYVNVDWDKDFLKMENKTLFELIRAANRLDVKGLLDATTTAVAELVKNKNTHEIRQFFGVAG